jgi:protein tyrosine/serine phosphatase
MTIGRHLDWEGGFNIRDLGGIATNDGRKTRRSSVVRSGSLHHLTKPGWQALATYGVRTIIDLRNTNEREAANYIAPNSEITCIHLPLEEQHEPSDAEFWKRWRGFNCSPLYYSAFLNQYPDRASAVIAHIANARPGGVLFHCGIGRDRTGLIALLLLKILGATHEEIVSDFLLSIERLRTHWARIGLRNDEDDIAKLFEREKSSATSAIIATITDIDGVERFRTNGIGDNDLDLLRTRFLE